MGLFVLDLSIRPTVETRLEAAIANIELFLPEGDGEYKDEIGQTPLYYLLRDFALPMIKEALELHKEVQ